MAFKITDFDGTVTAPGGAYPYGQIKDDPGGTAVNTKSNGDIMQFFQRMCADAGVTLNSTPDNSTNGFQFVQAVNTLWAQYLNGMDAGFRGSTAALVPIIMSGMVSTGSNNMTGGYCFYNGKFYQVAGFSDSFTTPGDVVVLTFSTPDSSGIITTTDGMYTASSAQATSVSPSAGSCDLSVAVNWSTAVGIDNLNTNVTSLLAVTAFGTWTNLPALTSPWISGGVSNYKKDGSGKVNFEGSVTYNSTGTPSGVLCTMPVGFRPTTDQVFVLNGQNGIGGYMAVSVGVATTGEVTVINVPVPGGSAFYLDLVQIQYYTT